MENTPDNGERTRRHTLPADVAADLRAARLARGLGLRATARSAGIPPGYLCMLEQGARCPSVAVARDLVAALELDGSVADRLLELARPDAGRSWRPQPD